MESLSRLEKVAEKSVERLLRKQNAAEKRRWKMRMRGKEERTQWAKPMLNQQCRGQQNGEEAIFKEITVENQGTNGNTVPNCAKLQNTKRKVKMLGGKKIKNSYKQGKRDHTAAFSSLHYKLEKSKMISIKVLKEFSYCIGEGSPEKWNQ